VFARLASLLKGVKMAEKKKIRVKYKNGFVTAHNEDIAEKLIKKGTVVRVVESTKKVEAKPEKKVVVKKAKSKSKASSKKY
jgi:anaerobic selenocysteine-containing dehydrogenase